MNPFEKDPFEELPLPELKIPEQEGWTISLFMRNERGPVWHVSHDTSNEVFLMSNRSFEQMDYYTSHKLLATIIKKIKENPGRKIVIADIGGGVLSQCVRGMLRHPFLKGKVQCINIDPFAQPIDPAELEQENIDPHDLQIVQEDFLTCAQAENTADVIWSYQVLDGITDERFPAFIEKIAGLLAPGGEAWLNERWKLNLHGDPFTEWRVHPDSGGNHWLNKIANQHCVTIRQAFGETTLDGHTHIFMSSNAPFVYMGKQQKNGLFPSMEFSAAFPEITEAVKKY